MVTDVENPENRLCIKLQVKSSINCTTECNLKLDNIGCPPNAYCLLFLLICSHTTYFQWQ